MEAQRPGSDRGPVTAYLQVWQPVRTLGMLFLVVFFMARIFVVSDMVHGVDKGTILMCGRESWRREVAKLGKLGASSLAALGRVGLVSQWAGLAALGVQKIRRLRTRPY